MKILIATTGNRKICQYFCLKCSAGNLPRRTFFGTGLSKAINISEAAVNRVTRMKLPYQKPPMSEFLLAFSQFAEKC